MGGRTPHPNWGVLRRMNPKLSRCPMNITPRTRPMHAFKLLASSCSEGRARPGPTGRGNGGKASCFGLPRTRTIHAWNTYWRFGMVESGWSIPAPICMVRAAKICDGKQFRLIDFEKGPAETWGGPHQRDTLCTYTTAGERKNKQESSLRTSPPRSPS